MTAYYNEIDPFAAQWLRNLIAAGHIAPGVVDTRSIEDITPNELREFTQCHFFAGIGVWSLALRRAGWADDRPVWTGSCPCQPFSSAGAGGGFADERHLWPAMFHLIEQCKPAVVFGEQVASKDANPWIDLVQTDLEAVGYGVGAIAFPSASVGAPHIRDRLYWVADTSRERVRTEGLGAARAEAQGMRGTHGERQWVRPNAGAGGSVSVDGLADAADQRQHGWRAGQAGDGRNAPRVEPERLCDAGERPSPTNGFWRDADWLLCRDGKWRPVEPGTFPLVNGVAPRVVYTCAQCNTETVGHEKMRTVRKIPSRYEGLRSEAVLLNEMLRSVDNCSSDDATERAVSSAIQVCSHIVQSLRCKDEAGTASRGRESDEQCAGKYRDTLPKMPRRAPPTVHPTNTSMQSVRECFRSAEMAELNMFCPVCAGMGPHQRVEEVGGSRSGRLRAYGNAINAQAAQVFIESYLESVR